MAASGAWKVANLHQHGAKLALIVLPGLLMNAGIAGFADRAQGQLLTHGNF
jgi:hypothetical protein